MTFVSYAQNFEDVILMRTFADVRSGLYIDVGAQDPTVDSVSRAFHARGWRGVHVEPSPHYAELLRHERPQDVVIQAAITEEPGIVTFFDIPGTGISTIDRTIAQGHRDRGHQVIERQVAALPLSMVLEQCAGQTVQWLKLDVEGAEQAALRSWGDAALRPLVVVVESTLPMTQTPTHQHWEPMLLDKGYQFAYFDGLNRYYLSTAAVGLQARLAVPPNVFDDFELHGTANAPFHRGLLRQHEAAEAAHAAQVASLQTEMAVARAASQRQLEQRDVAHRHALQHALTEAAAQDSNRVAEVQRLDELCHRTADQLEAAQRALLAQQAASRDEIGGLRDALALGAAQALQLESRLARMEAQQQAAQDQLAGAEARLAAATREHQQQLSRQTTQHAELLRTLSIEHTQELERTETQWRQRWLEMRQDHARALAQATAHHAKLLESAQTQFRLQTDAAQRAAIQQAEAFESSRQQAQAHFESALAARTEQARQQDERQEARIADLVRALADAEDRARQDAAAALAERQQSRQVHAEALDALDHERARLAAEADSLRAQLDALLRGAEADLRAAANDRQALALQLMAIHRSWAWKLSAPVRRLRSQGDPLASATALAMGSPVVSLSRHLAAATPPPDRATDTTDRLPEPESHAMHRDLDPPKTISELLAHHDEEFVNHAYQLLLGRNADSAGFASYLNLVRAGAAKEGLVVAMAQSDEGRRHGAQAPGLAELLGTVRPAAPGRVSRLLARWMHAALEPGTVQLRAIQNQLYRSERAASQAQDHLRTIARALQGLQGRLRELEQRLPAAGSAATTAAPAQGAALPEPAVRLDDFSQQLARLVEGVGDGGATSAQRAESARALAEAQATLGAGGRAVFGRWAAAVAAQDTPA